MQRIIMALLCLLVVACAASADGVIGGDTVTIPREEWENLKSRVADLESLVQQLVETKVSEETIARTESLSESPSEEQTGGGRQLALPDVSFIAQAKGRTDSDTRDEARNRTLLTEGEICIQGWVYPKIKADAFITMSPAEESPAQIEEAYLTYLGLGKGLNACVGKKHVPFGRTNLLHSHSWPYVNQPLVIQNLVAEESLVGQGLQATYLIPAGDKLFAQLDAGTWSFGEEQEATEPPDVLIGPGANFTNRFDTARLWTSYPVTENAELELGGSYAKGTSLEQPVIGVSHTTLTGADLSYRWFGEQNKRLLLRAETFLRREDNDLGPSQANGYYLFGDYRWDKYTSGGLRYDWTQYPQSPDLHQSAVSLILTKQFQEQYYLRLQATHGSRPGDDSYTECWLQWCWGVGPHTHNLE